MASFFDSKEFKEKGLMNVKTPKILKKMAISQAYRAGKIEPIAKMKFWFGANEKIFKKGLLIEKDDNQMVTIWKKKMKKEVKHKHHKAHKKLKRVV
jgi:hypothetical protein